MGIVNRSAFYRYDPDGNAFAGLGLHKDDYDVTDMHSRFTRESATWKPLVLEIIEDSPSKLGDFPALVDRRRIPVFSERAWGIFKPYLSAVAEALPVVTTNGTRLLMIHVYKPIAALVEERCSFDRFSDGGVRRVNKFCFDWENIGTAMMAKLPPNLGGDLLLSHQFRQVAEENGLCGLNFVDVSQCD